MRRWTCPTIRFVSKLEMKLERGSGFIVFPKCDICWDIGGHGFSVSSENLETVMYCHSKYNCPALNEAAAAYIDWANKQHSPPIDAVISIFVTSARFKLELNLQKVHDKYAAYLVSVWPTIER